MTKDICRIGSLFVLTLIIGSGCGLVPVVPYSMPGMTSVPLGLQVADDTRAFAETFCATLTHLDPSHAEWGRCAQYLEGTAMDQPPVTEVIPKTLGVVVVSGMFSDCFEKKGIYSLQQAREHLTSEHGLMTDLVEVDGIGTPEANAETIDKYLRAHPGNYIAVGHSKGAVDLMTAIQRYPSAQSQIKVLVSIAGAIGGSRLIDLGKDLNILGFQQAAQASGLGHCDLQKAWPALESLRRDKRSDVLRNWKPPASLRSYSVVAVANDKDTSSVLSIMRRRVSYYSQDQDSQMIAEEALIPGGHLLAVAHADHWAVAWPFSDHPDPKIRKRVNRNRYPRVALLEAIVRYVQH
jgi:hypothetical protein